MVNQNTSIVAALFARAMSLDTVCDRVANYIQKFDPPSGSVSRRLFERAYAARCDAWDSYRAAAARTGRLEQTFVEDDMHVLDYVNSRLS